MRWESRPPPQAIETQEEWTQGQWTPGPAASRLRAMTTPTLPRMPRALRLAFLPCTLLLLAADSDPDLPKSGEWSIITTLTGLTLPDTMGPEQAARLRARAAEGPPPVRECVAAPLDQAEGLFRMDNPGCAMDRYERSGGQLVMTMHCDDGEDRMTVEMSGPYSNGTFDLVGTVVATGLIEGGKDEAVIVTMDVAGRRIGDCPQE